MLAIDWPLWLILTMFLVALLAGWVDTLAGGGGLLTLPALMLAGLPPVSALATNKAQGFVGTLTATLMLLAKGQLNIVNCLPLVLAAAIGSMLGTLLIQRVDTSWLHWGIPFLLIGVAGYFLASPQVGKVTTSARQSEKIYGITAVPLIGFYDGAIGPGAGSFFAASGVMLRGQTLLQATIRAKLLNFTTNVISMAVFAAAGQVAWLIALAMMLGQFCGASLASHTMLNGGEKLIRPLVIAMCILMSCSQVYKLLFS
ncbi:MAG: TSUP family transporter [Desulforhopalus sp.]|nr:TSUP family transporter [Desulforhopalus sp.]